VSGKSQPIRHATRPTLGALSFPLAAAVLAGLLLGACATAGEMEAVQARVDVLEREREQVREKMAEDMGKLERLHAMLVEAEETLRKSGADLGLRVERLEQEIPKTRGELEAMAVKLRQVDYDLSIIKRELAERLGSTAVYLPANTPTDAAGLWELADARVKAKELMEAQALYEHFAAGFPDDPRAPLAFFRLGEAFEGAGDLENAVKHYQSVYDRFPSSPEAPGAVMRIAAIFVKKGDCARAKNLYRFVETTFKGTDEAADAKKRGKTVLKECSR
jgi:TolA-binding protein